MSQPPVSFRVATQDDLDNITRVAQAGFPDDPEWNYRFPYRSDYPKDNWKWTRRDYQLYLGNPEKFTVLVATTPDDRSEQESKIIALAVWNIAVTTADKPDGYGMYSIVPK
jgi:hypothetical protein